MSKIIYPLKPGGGKGQMNREEREDKAKKYIELVKQDKNIISEEWSDSMVVLVTED
jgi:hypothetical protein